MLTLGQEDIMENWSSYIKSAHTYRKTDDIPNRPVIYIKVTEMAPVRSRLQGLAVHETPPTYIA